MRLMARWLVAAILLLQIVAGIRVILRLATSARGARIETVRQRSGDVGAVSVIVPVLNEASRLAPCLDGLMAQGEDVAEILVVDGGSTDATTDVVRSYAERDVRVRLIDAAPIPDDWNGKPWGLHVGLRHTAERSRWILTIDADVRPKPALAPSLLAHAARHGLRVLSVATPQRVSGLAESPIHTSLLTTLVYRYGIPGQATLDPESVQANGQCFLIERNLLDQVGGFASVAKSLVEDVTLARHCAATGQPVGFFQPAESDALVTVEMYGGWYDALVNWSRSLPMRDRYSSGRSWVRIADVVLTMGLPPLALLAAALWQEMPCRWQAVRVNTALLMTRIGTQIGVRRAYEGLPETHWAAVLADPVVIAVVVRRALQRRHVWRDRVAVVEPRAGANSMMDTDDVPVRDGHAANARATS